MGKQIFETIKIGELGKIVTGKTPPTERLELFGSAYPFITPTDIQEESRIVETARYISEQGRKFQKNLLLPSGTVCFTCIGATIGKICITQRLSFSNQQINSIIVDQTQNDNKYVYYLLKHETPSIKVHAGGAATPIISKSVFSDIEVNIPPLPIQRRIANILSTYDDLIENNTRRIRILEQIAQMIYQEWFGKVDKVNLPGGWLLCHLSEIADVNSTSITNGNEPDEIKYVDIASVSTGTIDSFQTISFSNAPSRARRIVRHGDVIWSTVRPNRKSFSLIIHPPKNMIVSTGFAVLRAKTVPFSFLYLATTTENFSGYLTNHATGAAYPAVNSSDFESAEIVLPPKDLLSRFENIISPMLVEREILLRKNSTLRQTRDLLLPHLISGDVDVSGMEIN